MRPVCDTNKYVKDTNDATEDDIDDYIAAANGITNNSSVRSGALNSPLMLYNIDVNDNNASNLEN